MTWDLVRIVHPEGLVCTEGPTCVHRANGVYSHSTPMQNAGHHVHACTYTLLLSASFATGLFD